MRLHRRQFILGPRPVHITAEWQSAPVDGYGHLSYSPELPVTRVLTGDGPVAYLLGLAVQIAGKASPGEELRAATAQSVSTHYRWWAGRWILLIGSQLHMDAAGLLGCFYARQPPPEGEKALWVSSSAALLRQVLETDDKPMRSIHHAVGIDWYPPPGSRFESIRRLLPSQILELSSGALLPRPLLLVAPAHYSYEETLDRMQGDLVGAVRGVADRSGELWLALTAGYDSRTLLAAAMYAGVRVRTYTHIDKYMRNHDRIIPPKLAAAAGMTHEFYAGGSHRRDLLDLFDEHTAGHSIDRDRYYFARQYFGWSQPGDTILRGLGFELGRCNYWSRFPGRGPKADVPDADVILKGMRDRSRSTREPLQEWIAWTQAHPEPAMDWRDRFYLEQRLAGWASSVEQALDLVDGDVFHAANSQSYYANVLQVPEEKRCRSLHQEDLIRRMAPELLKFEFNRPDPSYRRVIRKALRATEYLRTLAASRWTT